MADNLIVFLEKKVILMQEVLKYKV